MVIKYRITLLVLCFQAIYLNSQTINPDKEIEKYFAAIQKNESFNLPANTIKEADASKILKLATKNIDNEDTRIRYKVIDVVKRKINSISNPEERTKYASFLIEAIKDPDGGNSGVASKSLTYFQFSDFNNAAKDSIYALLGRNTSHYEQIVKLTGFLQIEKALKLFKDKVRNDSTLSKNNKWMYSLALTRMGDKESIEYCRQKADALPINDKTVSLLYPDLVYTRQPQLIKIVLDQILSDEKKCNSPNPDSEENIICAFKIMEMVSPVIKDFPVKVDKYGDLDISNYDEALVKARDWIKANPEPELLEEIY